MICWQRTYRVPVWTPSAQVEQKLCMGRIKHVALQLVASRFLYLTGRPKPNCLRYLFWHFWCKDSLIACHFCGGNYLDPKITQLKSGWIHDLRLYQDVGLSEDDPPRRKFWGNCDLGGFLLPVMIHYLKTTESRSMGSMESEGGWRQVSHDPLLYAPKLLLKYWHVFSRNGS